MPGPFSPRLALSWTVLATFGLWLGIAAVFVAFPRAAQSIVLLGLVQVAVYALVLRVFAAAQGIGVRELLALQRASLGVCLASALLGFALQIPATLLSDAVEHFFPTSAATLAERAARVTPHSPLQAAAILLVVVGLGPAIEEFFFRGALFGALRRGHGRGTTILTVAACFALAHMDARLFLPLFVAALALGAVRELSASIWPGLALHAAFNGATLAVVFSGGAPSGKAPPMPISIAVCGCAATLALLYCVRVLALSDSGARVRTGS